MKGIFHKAVAAAKPPSLKFPCVVGLAISSKGFAFRLRGDAPTVYDLRVSYGGERGRV